MKPDVPFFSSTIQSSVACAPVSGGRQWRSNSRHEFHYARSILMQADSALCFCHPSAIDVTQPARPIRHSNRFSRKLAAHQFFQLLKIEPCSPETSRLTTMDWRIDDVRQLDSLKSLKISYQFLIVVSVLAIRKKKECLAAGAYRPTRWLF